MFERYEDVNYFRETLCSTYLMKYWIRLRGSFIYYVHKIFRKTNVSDTPDTHTKLSKSYWLVTFYSVLQSKWMCVRLQTKSLRIRIPFLSLKLKISRLFWVRSSLTLRQLYSVVHSETCTSYDNIQTVIKLLLSHTTS